MRTAAIATANTPTSASAPRCRFAPAAAKNSTRTGSAPRSTASRSASPSGGAMFSTTSPAPSAASSGSKCNARADLAEQDRHAEQHHRHLASDVAQVEREARADDAAEGERSEDLPRQAGEDAVARLAAAEREAHALHRQREQQDQHQVGEHDQREHQFGERAAGPALGDHRDAHRRREAHRDGGHERGQRDARQSRDLGRDRQPRPRQEEQHASASPTSARASRRPSSAWRAAADAAARS